MMDIAAAQVQTFDAEAIILGRSILFDIAARFERREQSKDIVLMQLETLGKLRDPELIDFAEELFEYVERMRHRLNNVVCLLAAHHFVLSFVLFRNPL